MVGHTTTTPGNTALLTTMSLLLSMAGWLLTASVLIGPPSFQPRRILGVLVMALAMFVAGWAAGYALRTRLTVIVVIPAVAGVIATMFALLYSGLIAYAFV